MQKKEKKGAKISLREILRKIDFQDRKALRIALLILTTLLIAGATALVYASMVYEKALDVNNANGVITGSGAASSAGVSFTPVTIMMLAAPVLVVGVSMFGLLREGSKQISNAPGGRGLSPTGLGSMSPEAPGIGLSLSLSSAHGEEWEESPKKDEGEE
jgi:Na+/Pi-cotransporter